MARRYVRRKVRGKKRGVPWGRYARYGMKALPYVVQGVKMLKDIVNAEKHYFDTTGTVASVSNAGSIVCLNQIAAGTDTQNRSGNSILTNHLSGKLTFQESVAVGATDTFVRLLIIQDLDNQGTDPTLTQILEDTSNPIVSPINKDYSQRFWILTDKIMGFDDYNRTRFKKIWKKIKFHIRFRGTASSDYSTNSVYLVMCSDTASDGPTATYSLRLCFYDN